MDGLETQFALVAFEREVEQCRDIEKMRSLTIQACAMARTYQKTLLQHMLSSTPDKPPSMRPPMLIPAEMPL
jgi:hypothetical protein